MTSLVFKGFPDNLSLTRFFRSEKTCFLKINISATIESWTSNFLWNQIWFQYVHFRGVFIICRRKNIVNKIDGFGRMDTVGYPRRPRLGTKDPGFVRIRTRSDRTEKKISKYWKTKKLEHVINEHFRFYYNILYP